MGMITDELEKPSRKKQKIKSLQNSIHAPILSHEV